MREVHDQIRGLSPHVGAWLNVDGERLGIWRAVMIEHASEALGVYDKPGEIWHDTQRLIIGTGDGAIEVLELQPPGKRRMASGDWLRGLRTTLQRAEAPQVAPK